MFFFENYSMLTLATLIGVILALLVVNEITRRYKWAAIVCYIILPIICSIVLWPKTAAAGTSGGNWFAWVKTYSALAGVIGFMAIRYIKKVENSKFTIIFPMAILVINILEAIVRDLEVSRMTGQVDSGLVMLGGPWNILNAIAGVFLVLSLTGWMSIQVSNKPSRDMVWADQLWFWILAYDLWNMSYCYNCISSRSMYAGFAILIACTIAEFAFQKGIWLQHRAFTLALWGMFSLSMDYASLPAFGITSTHNPAALLTLSILSLVANVAVFVYGVYTIRKTRRNPFKQDIYTHLASYQENLTVNDLSPNKVKA